MHLFLIIVSIFLGFFVVFTEGDTASEKLMAYIVRIIMLLLFTWSLYLLFK